MPSHLPRAAARSLALLAVCLLAQGCRYSGGGDWTDPGGSDGGTPDAGELQVLLELDKSVDLLPDGRDAATVTLTILGAGATPLSSAQVQWQVEGEGAALASATATGAGAAARVRLAATAPGSKVVRASVQWNGSTFALQAHVRFGPSRTPSPCPGRSAPRDAASAADVVLARPTAYAVGDFNGDGAVELAVPDATSGSLRIRLNDGRGAFTDGQALVLGSGVEALARGDLNGDGKVDLVVGTQDRRVRVLLGNGDGTFAAQSGRLASSGVPAALVLGDLNGDGRPDVVAIPSSESASADHVTLFWNTGGGALGPGVEVAVGASPVALAVVDVDGDGQADSGGGQPRLPGDPPAPEPGQWLLRRDGERAGLLAAGGPGAGGRGRGRPAGCGGRAARLQRAGPPAQPGRAAERVAPSPRRRGLRRGGGGSGRRRRAGSAGVRHRPQRRHLPAQPGRGPLRSAAAQRRRAPHLRWRAHHHRHSARGSRSRREAGRGGGDPGPSPPGAQPWGREPGGAGPVQRAGRAAWRGGRSQRRRLSGRGGG